VGCEFEATISVQNNAGVIEITVQWDSVYLTSYVIEYSTDLLLWLPIATIPNDPVGPLGTTFAAPPGETLTFYRIVAY
jgi:hypothetical protein